MEDISDVLRHERLSVQSAIKKLELSVRMLKSRGVNSTISEQREIYRSVHVTGMSTMQGT